MKTCPSCNRSYTDEALNFCLQDGSPLVNVAALPSETTATARYPVPEMTGLPAIYHANPVPPPPMAMESRFQPQISLAPVHTMPIARNQSQMPFGGFGGL
jgi:hypothetical protein